MKNWRRQAIRIFTYATAFVAFRAIAQQDVDMQHWQSKQLVSCHVPAWNSGFVGVEASQLLDWCVKACGAHGFNRAVGSLSFHPTGGLAADPSLTPSEWQLPAQTPPSECLPYEPAMPKLELQKEKCLSYGNRARVSGMLAKYSGWGWTITHPSSKCVHGDATDIFKRPSEKSLHFLGVEVPPGEESRYRKLVGRQILISGKLSIVLGSDTVRLTLKDIRLAGSP